MVHRQLYFAVGLILFVQSSVRAQNFGKRINIRYSALEVTSEESQDVEELIDQLVFADGKASNEPVLGPGVKDKSLEYAQRFKKVQDAFDKLESLKVKAFPILVKALR